MDYAERWNRNRVEWLYQLARTEEVGPSAVRVGLLFATFLQPEEREEVRPSFEWLVKNAHMSRQTLSTSIRELEEAGFLDVTRHHAESTHYSMPFTGDEEWRRARRTPYVAKVRKNPPRGKRKKIASKN